MPSLPSLPKWVNPNQFNAEIMLLCSMALVMIMAGKVYYGWLQALYRKAPSYTVYVYFEVPCNSKTV